MRTDSERCTLSKSTKPWHDLTVQAPAVASYSSMDPIYNTQERSLDSNYDISPVATSSIYIYKFGGYVKY